MTTDRDTFLAALPVAAALMKAGKLANRMAAVEQAAPFAYQIAPPGDWFIWAFIAGRQVGKTWTGSWQVIEHLRKYGPSAWVNIGAPTRTDVKLVCLEGESGLYTRFKREFLDYNSSELTLTHRNGGHVRGISCEVPNRWRGPLCSFLWLDEFAVLAEEAVDNALIGLSIGDDPRALFTSTPRNRPLVKRLLADPRAVVTKAITYDNKKLSASKIAFLKDRYEGTALGRQEIYGELIDDAENGLFKRAWFDASRVFDAPAGGYASIVVAVDPAASGTAGVSSSVGRTARSINAGGSTRAQTGIVAAGRGQADGRVYMLRSVGLHAMPDVWAGRVLDIYEELEANKIVIEVNQGGEMATGVIQAAARERKLHVRIESIRAFRGKSLRAEPVSVLYQQGKVSHVGHHSELEDQLALFPSDSTLVDLVDAAVYAVQCVASATGVVLSEAMGAVPGSPGARRALGIAGRESSRRGFKIIDNNFR